MDITDSLAPASDQLDAIELAASGPRTFTVEAVSKGSAEQPVEVHLVGFPRVWRPSKGMRRTLAAGWGVDASKWVGRSVTLFCDPDVSFGKERTGGTRISHMSHLPGNKRLSVPLLISRGKSVMFTVEPLAEVKGPAKLRENSTTPTPDQIAAETDVAALRGLWHDADDEGRALIQARVAELTQPGGDQ